MARKNVSADSFKVKAGIAKWSLNGDLGIARATELLQEARRIADDRRVQKLTVEIADPKGVPLPTYQILISLQRSLEASGKTFDVTGTLAPMGGRSW